MSNLDHPRDRRSHRPRHLPLARNPEPGRHACAGSETWETAALRTLLSHRREGEFVDAEGMDARLARMIAEKLRRPSLAEG